MGLEDILLAFGPIGKGFSDAQSLRQKLGEEALSKRLRELQVAQAEREINEQNLLGRGRIFSSKLAGQKDYASLLGNIPEASKIAGAITPEEQSFIPEILRKYREQKINTQKDIQDQRIKLKKLQIEDESFNLKKSLTDADVALKNAQRIKALRGPSASRGKFDKERYLLDQTTKYIQQNPYATSEQVQSFKSKIRSLIPNSNNINQKEKQKSKGFRTSLGTNIVIKGD